MTRATNHLKLARFHLVLSASYVCLLIVVAMNVSGHAISRNPLFVLLPVMLAALHAGLSVGAKYKLELSRKLSVAVGVLMLLSFPIGTFIAIFFLPYTQWQENQEQDALETAPRQRPEP